VADDIAPVAEFVATTLATSEARLYEQLNTGFNWLLATLFTAHGGALVALLSNENLSVHPSRAALVCFSVGLVLSILMGLGNVAYAALAIIPTTKIRMSFVAFQSGKAAFEDVLESMKSLDKEFGFVKWATYASGVLSVVALVCGMAFFGASF
jgi:hypothetical protein